MRASSPDPPKKRKKLKHSKGEKKRRRVKDRGAIIIILLLLYWNATKLQRQLLEPRRSSQLTMAKTLAASHMHILMMYREIQ